MRPPQEPSYPRDLSALERNPSTINEVFESERTYEHRGHVPSNLGRVIDQTRQWYVDY